MKKQLLIALLLAAGMANAEQLRGFRMAKSQLYVHYVTYEARSMTRQDLGRLGERLRTCQRATARQFIQREKLAQDNNITGAFYCRLPNETRAFAVVKKLK